MTFIEILIEDIRAKYRYNFIPTCACIYQFIKPCINIINACAENIHWWIRVRVCIRFVSKEQ